METLMRVRGNPGGSIGVQLPDEARELLGALHGLVIYSSGADGQVHLGQALI
jgi:hypothetical protein